MTRPRPVAGVPAADPRALARAWLAARISAATLEAAGELASRRFVDEAPGVCGSLLAALGDDAALDAIGARHGAVVARLAADGAGGSPGCAAAAPDAPPPPLALGILAAVEQLRAVVADDLSARADVALLPGLHDRLAHACVVLAQAAIAPAGPADGVAVRDVREGRGVRPPAGAGDGVAVRDAREGRDDRPPADPRAHLTAETERLVAAGTGFALLVVEVEDASVIPAAALAAAEAALRAALPPGATHAPDGPGSVLVLAPRADGRELARSLTRAVAAAAGHHGAPLRAAAGVAHHPADADTPADLLARADGQLFAARAEGLPLA